MYYLNPAEMSGMFPVPSSVTDKHIKFANALQLKVLLWCLRNGCSFDASNVSEALKLDKTAVCEALDYWADCKVLLSTEPEKATNDEPSAPAPKKKIALKGNAVKPTREEAAKRGLECPEIAFILRETEQTFGRLLRPAEVSTLVWLYDDQGISASLLLMIVGFAKAEGRVNIGFIERTAVEWISDGVENVADAEARLVKMKRQQTAWHLVETAMGLEHRSPSKAELEAADKWVNTYNYGRDIIRLAYEVCVDTTSKFSMPYVKKVIDSWHKAGVKTVTDVEALSNTKQTATTKSTLKSSGDDYQAYVNSLIMKNEED